MLPESRRSLIRQCAAHVGLTTAEIAAIARTGPIRYKIYEIRKKSGGVRVIAQPSRELKQLQYFFLEKILSQFPVHEAAAAYVTGSSIRKNAERHIGSRVILKLDFRAFFPSIRVVDWRKFVERNCPDWDQQDIRFSEKTLFFGARSVEPFYLSIGAPTSPAISNIMMFRFDEEMSMYCRERGLYFTRYADDITISSREFIEQEEVIAEVKAALGRLNSPMLELNSEKTLLFSKRHNRTVTGLVLSSQGEISLGRARKREISTLVHRAGHGLLSAKELARLKGLLAFSLDAEPAFVARLSKKYTRELVERILGS